MQKPVSLRNLDLNLLPVLQALLRLRNVTRAADALGMSQPGVTKALARLRAGLDDPLLVRQGRVLVLTPRAEALRAEVDELCQRCEAVWRPEKFNPATASRIFMIAGADYAPLVLLPALAPRLSDEAPGISLRFCEVGYDDVVDRDSDMDFLIVPRLVLDGYVARGGHAVRLFDDEFVPVVSRLHPLANAPSAASAINSYPHISFWAPDTTKGRSRSIEYLTGGGAAHVTAIPQFGALPLLALLTNAVSVAPRRIIRLMEQYLPIAIVEEPTPRARVEICLAWSARLARDPSHIWLRTLIQDLFRDELPSEVSQQRRDKRTRRNRQETTRA